ncbi:unnamed protein product [Clonostachys byssicola]|uniref:2EXR domain-containing protein n=1 Tax=Clonostachys byssicola TaxID=160290 RepID=A0A9N9YAN8_9HYPO|nr:unnamed protein product [Clonostachys byssicola]
MSASDPYPTFPLFPDLPPELRNQIWLNAMPTLKPSIHLYHRGCWLHQPLNPSDEGYGLDDEGPPVSFRLELVKKTWLEAPLVYVNYEARQAALKWGEQHGMPFCSLPDTERLVFLRSFNANIDALGVPYEEWENLILELADRQSEPDLINQTVRPISAIKQFILSERMLKSCVSEIDELFEVYCGLETVYIIDGEMPELDAASSATGLLQSWEYEPSGVKGWRWDPEQRRLAAQENTQIRSPTLYALMEEAARVVTEAFTRYAPHFAIVPSGIVASIAM